MAMGDAGLIWRWFHNDVVRNANQFADEAARTGGFEAGQAVIRRRGNLTEGLYIGLDYKKVCFVQKNFS